mmetsp:Transcript_32124/g.42597  ORF Transcript_32124/g.42597 Transcript_32124/m.42597 type:complete len:85 (-) Transcript_32124:196-450(-)
MISVHDAAMKSNSMLGHVDSNAMSPLKEDPFSKSMRASKARGESAASAFDSNMKKMTEGKNRPRNYTLGRESQYQKQSLHGSDS